MVKLTDLFDLKQTVASVYLSGFEYPWEALEGISTEIIRLISVLDKWEYSEIGDNVWVHNTATVAPTASITGPCIIGANTEVRHCAFIRGNALVGNGCVVGNSVELKNVILFNKVQVPHYNYVGDSILGYCAHMGAGSITSNVKSDQKPVQIKKGNGEISTGRKKVGAFLGDYAEIGCGSVLNPGTVIGRNSNVYPLTALRGVVPEGCIVKSVDQIIVKK